MTRSSTVFGALALLGALIIFLGSLIVLTNEESFKELLGILLVGAGFNLALMAGFLLSLKRGSNG